MSAALSQLYPLSTDGGQSIPLDVIWPVSVSTSAILKDDETPFLIPPGTKIACFFCDIPVLVDFNGAATYPISGLVENALFVPAETLITSAIPETGMIRIIPLISGKDGKLVVQIVSQWAAMGQGRSLVRR